MGDHMDLRDLCPGVTSDGTARLDMERNRCRTDHETLCPTGCCRRDQSVESSVLAVIHKSAPISAGRQHRCPEACGLYSTFGTSSRRLHSRDASARRFECDQRTIYT